jgi:hypothetical protein
MASWSTDKEKAAAAAVGLISIGLTSVLTYLIAQNSAHEARISVLESKSIWRDTSEREYREEIRESLRRLEDMLQRRLHVSP